ncbi:hypothetical protein D3C75_746360 [compost metagenome]
MHVMTDRLIIRSFECKDWPTVLEYNSNISVMKYIPEGVFDEETVKEFIKKPEISLSY